MPSPLSIRPYSAEQKAGPLPIFHGTRRRKNSDSLTTNPSKKSRGFGLSSLRVFTPSYHGRKRGPCLTFLVYLLVIVAVCLFGRRYMSRQRTWPVIGPSSTLVYKRKDLQSIWLWEIASGHHPSRRKMPEELAPISNIANPAHPAIWRNLPPSAFENKTAPGRNYLDLQPKGIADTSYPPRPLAGTIADLDVIMEHCDFGNDKFVRDCLEVMRMGGGLDNGRRVRRDSKPYRYIFTQEDNGDTVPVVPIPPVPVQGLPPQRSALFQNEREPDMMDGTFRRATHAEWEPTLKLAPPRFPATTCDPDEPRIFHMYWTGPFTDKPNLTLLSFLFTQNIGLNQPPGPDDDAVPPCRPKLWLWVDPSPASIITDHDAAYKKLVTELKSNKWSAPFLHPRFKDVIEIKLWNLFEQLDSVDELKDDWRQSKALLNSGGHNINVPQKKKPAASAALSSAQAEGTQEDGIVEIPAEMKEKLSTVLSDLVRFILVHRFGGVYLDTDTVFLRDWEELWNWRGAFAYRWSWHDKYNTAVLRMHKGSALGTFILRTALKNNLDFHPMSISDYLKDAKLDDLLYRLPDALFDSAWLNMEGYQRDRPPQPYFRSFEEFFNTPSVDSAAPQALGFDGFFKGAFSYHFHNTWWRPVDASYSCPDLGARFIMPTDPITENTTTIATSTAALCGTTDQRDLDWSTVLKRTFEAFLREERPNLYGEWIQY